eukprot:scaffold45412_cov46-Prasinocladus_malaysianus.AAC.2
MTAPVPSLYSWPSVLFGSDAQINHASVDTIHIKDDTDDVFMDEDQSPFYHGKLLALCICFRFGLSRLLLAFDAFAVACLQCQKVRVASAFILQHSHWIRGSFKGKREGVIVHVDAGMDMLNDDIESHYGHLIILRQGYTKQYKG